MKGNKIIYKIEYILAKKNSDRQNNTGSLLLKMEEETFL